MKGRVLLLLSLVLSGCATRPQVLTEQQHYQVALLDYLVDQCPSQNLMSPETAAVGVRLFRSISTSEAVLPDLLAEKRALLRSQNQPVDSGVCNRAATQILATAPNQAGGAQATPQPTYPIPTTTNCFTVQGWTRCSTF